MDNIDLLKITFLFTKFDEAMLSDLSSQIQELSIPKGITFVKEKEQADAFYIIKDGAVEIFTLGNENEEIILAKLEKGAYFGEQALLETPPGFRSANVRTLTDTTLLKIFHSSFKKIIDFDRSLKNELKKIGYQQLINKIQAIESEYDISKYLLENETSYEVRDFSPGEIIIKENDPPDGVFFLLSGLVNVYKRNEIGIEELISTIKPNSLFGESGLILGRPRQATLKAQDSVKTLFIPPGKFRGLYQRQPKVKSIVDTLQKVYTSPYEGEVTQFIGRFLHLPAVITKYQLQEGREIISSRVVGKNILFIRQANIPNPTIYTYENKDIFRELHIANGRLVGVTAHGEWKELPDLYKKIFENQAISDTELQDFQKTGNLSTQY